ncbi:MAG TPA: SBBP repeat-containing protein, partial [Candidatus Acidoferrum sp.]|nr:SBBP repeat-containing protein [Candidatus Acidoferrum sp.]
RPIAYQEIDGVRHAVTARYVLHGSTVRFQLGAWDRHRPLVIDPTLTWAGFTGSTANTVYDDAQGVAVDATGNIYVTGTTVDPTYGDDDTFIVKLDPNGALIKRVTLGGEANDDGYGIAVDSTGAVYVVGSTDSVQWQITTTYAGLGTDAFYAKIDPTLSSYVYVGYYGGESTDKAYSCGLDASNNFYFGGATASTKFPVTRGAAQATSGGGWDGFVVKLDTNGAQAYATYVGGSGDDFLYSLALDASGNFYATGQTASSNLPVTPGAAQQSLGGGKDAFVAKYAAAGTLAWLTYLGGSGDDEANGIAVDASGSPVVTGGTASTNFPTVTPYQASSAGGARDMFVTRVSPDGTKFAWSTYLGGSADELGNAIALDNSGNVYVGGTTNSTNFPASSGWQGSNRGGADGTVTEFSADGSALLFSSYIGGTSADYVRSLAVNCTAGLIVVGSTQSSNFPGTLGAVPALNFAQGALIGFVAKVAAGTSTSAIAPGGIVNAATSSSAPVAPGSLVSIYGSDLAGSTGGAGSTPLPTSLNGATVTVNGATVPLVYVSPGQINFQLPFDAATGTASATVNSGCGASAPVSFPVSSAAPYLLLGVGGDALVANQDNSFNSESNAALKGSIVTVYLIGIGPLDKDISTGAATPADLFSARLPYKALIGGFDTSVKFLGMTPGFVGLAQANLEIPNLSPGKYPVIVTVNGVDSNAANIYVQ